MRSRFIRTDHSTPQSGPFKTPVMPTLYYLVSGRESKALAEKCQNQGATERCTRADRVILLDSNSEMALECKDVQCGTVRKGPDTEAILPPIRR